MKRAVQSAMRLGAEGIRINCSGRLGGAEIARMEWYREGRVPLHTLRADVDYGIADGEDGVRRRAASRCGSSRARSSSTIRWRRSGAREGNEAGSHGHAAASAIVIATIAIVAPGSRLSDGPRP
jgi:hypothetical protein